MGRGLGNHERLCRQPRLKRLKLARAECPPVKEYILSHVQLFISASIHPNIHPSIHPPSRPSIHGYIDIPTYIYAFLYVCFAGSQTRIHRVRVGTISVESRPVCTSTPGSLNQVPMLPPPRQRPVCWKLKFCAPFSLFGSIGHWALDQKPQP